MRINSLEIEMISRVLAVPLEAFGLDLLISKTNENKHELINIQKSVESLKIHTKINEKNFKKILSVFEASIEVIEAKDDIFTMTGFSLDEINRVKNKLAAMIS